MRFKLSSYAQDFLLGLEDETYHKVQEKLKDLEDFNQAHLLKAGRIKKISDGIYEVKISCYRFLGEINGEEFHIVHAFHKKSNKLPLKEISTTRNRINKLQL